MNFNDQPQYNSPNLLIGPLPYKFYNGCYAPDYSYPGVAERIKVEVDMIEDMAYDKRKL
jgi:hypothetical protein